MNCREFRRKHDAFIDDTLSGVDLDAMTRHRSLCERCAALDTRVRRALLIARNLPTIVPSDGFADRLSARIAEERALIERAGGRSALTSPNYSRSLSTGTYAALAAGLLITVGLATAMTLSSQRDEVIRLAPVVATRAEVEPASLMAPSMVAAVPAGMPLWPAVFVAQQAPWHLASDAAAH